MKKTFYTTLCLLLLLASCSEEEFNTEPSATICNTSNPVQELAWLKELVNRPVLDTQGCYTAIILQGIYQDNPVFLTGVSGGGLCCPCAGYAVLNCEGEMIFFCNPEEEKKISNKKIIWQRNK